jgi:hypothetical protein
MLNADRPRFEKAMRHRRIEYTTLRTDTNFLG